MTMPPPIPVPRLTWSRLLAPRPAPNFASPSADALASLTNTGIPSFWETGSASWRLRKPGICAATMTLPARESTMPAVAMQAATGRSGEPCATVARSPMTPAIVFSGRTSLVGVGTSRAAEDAPLSSDQRGTEMRATKIRGDDNTRHSSTLVLRHRT